MAEMTTHERMKCLYEHREADRAPIFDYVWDATLERWRREGMPEDANYVDYFGLDKYIILEADNSPRYPEEILEQTEEYEVKTTKWGVTLKNWKHMGGVPQFLDYTVKDRESWAKARERMKPTADRIDWEYLKSNYVKWRQEGAWLSAFLWFGFDMTHSWMSGTERILMAMVTDPDWVVEMFNHQLDVQLALYEQMWEAGYRFDEVNWADDMGYKGTQFFSLNMYRELLKPVHKRAVDWAHAKGVKVRLHSCGDIRPLIPDLIEIGVDMLNPLEVKAGMDPITIKKEYGDKLALHGGLNAILFRHPEEMWAEMQRIIPVMKQNGGYMIATDHSVPDSVSLEDFCKFVALAKELGSYNR